MPEATSCDDVVKGLREMRAPYGRTCHRAHGQVLTCAAADRATGVAPSSGELDIGGGTYLAARRYLDTYVCERDAWVFAQRRVRLHYVLPADEFGSSMSAAYPVPWPGCEPAPANPTRRDQT